MSMYDTIGTYVPSALLADPQGADLIGIPMEPGTGIVKRGTVVYRKASGLWAAAAAANAVITNMLAVLDEDVDITGGTAGGKKVAEDARAFRTGRFVNGAVTLAADAALTDAVKVVLRAQGIVFEPIVAPETFDNTVTG